MDSKNSTPAAGQVHTAFGGLEGVVTRTETVYCTNHCTGGAEVPSLCITAEAVEDFGPWISKGARFSLYTFKTA